MGIHPLGAHAKVVPVVIGCGDIMSKNTLIDEAVKACKQIGIQKSESEFIKQFRKILEKLYSDAFSAGYDAAPKSDSDRDSWND